MPLVTEYHIECDVPGCKSTPSFRAFSQTKAILTALDAGWNAAPTHGEWHCPWHSAYPPPKPAK
jgi:hypothetical protein